MARPGLRELVSFDHLVTPRLASLAFWLGQLANASIWGLILRSAYKEYDYDEAAVWSGPPMTEGEAAPDFGMPRETIQWDNIWMCLVLFLLGIVLVRVLVDLVLVRFRRLDTERAILSAMAGASTGSSGSPSTSPPAAVHVMAETTKPPDQPRA